MDKDIYIEGITHASLNGLEKTIIQDKIILYEPRVDFRIKWHKLRQQYELIKEIIHESRPYDEIFIKSENLKSPLWTYYLREILPPLFGLYLPVIKCCVKKRDEDEVYKVKINIGSSILRGWHMSIKVEEKISYERFREIIEFLTDKKI